MAAAIALDLNGGVEGVIHTAQNRQLVADIFGRVVGVVLCRVSQTDGDGQRHTACRRWVLWVGYPHGIMGQHGADIVLHRGQCLLEHQIGLCEVGTLRFCVHHHKAVHHHFRGKPVGIAVSPEVAAAVVAGQPCRHGMDAVGQDADVVFLLFGPCAWIGCRVFCGRRNLLHMGIGSQGAADGHMQPFPDGTRHGEA